MYKGKPPKLVSSNFIRANFYDEEGSVPFLHVTSLSNRCSYPRVGLGSQENSCDSWILLDSSNYPRVIQPLFTTYWQNNLMYWRLLRSFFDRLKEAYREFDAIQLGADSLHLIFIQ